MGAEKILVVETDEMLADLLRTLLEDAEYEPETAPGYPTALAALQRDPPALVLLDMDGIEGQAQDLVAEVRARHGGRVPIAILGESEQAEALAGEVGAQAWLGKGAAFDLGRFYSIVDSLTGRRSS